MRQEKDGEKKVAALEKKYVLFVFEKEVPGTRRGTKEGARELCRKLCFAQREQRQQVQKKKRKTWLHYSFTLCHF